MINRKVDLKDIIKTKSGKCDWKNSMGKKIHFEYDDIVGEFEIVGYKPEKSGVVIIKYKEEVLEIIASSLKNGNLGNILGKTKRKYKYNIGQIIKYEEEEWIIVGIDKYKKGETKYILECKKCGHIRTTDESSLDSSIQNNYRCPKCSKNKFELSEDASYWIGYTQNGDRFLFNGDPETVEYIKSQTWRKLQQGYFQNKKGEKLHRVVMGINDRNIFVNHIGGDRSDCRKEKLSISDCLDNSKEKRASIRNSTGVVGLMKRGKGDKYVGNIKIEGVNIYSKYKIRDEAIIDLLIMQKHYGFRHNIDLFYLIDNIDEDRVKEVIDNCERQIKAKRRDNILTTNNYELSEDGTYYNCEIIDNKKEKYYFKISIESLEDMKKGIWHIANCEGKMYVHGMIVENGKRKTVKLHRYLLGLIDVKYKLYFVDHKNGDELDNRLENLCITTPLGNGHKSNGEWIRERVNKHCTTWRVVRKIYGKKYDKTFKTRKEAEEYVNYLKNIVENEKPCWSSKEELDKYLQDNIDK